MARQLLPQFGGSPAVWSAASVFFQLALLAGYAYSFLLTRALGPRRQPFLHVPVLALPILFLPIVIPATAGSSGLPPAIAVIAVLALSVGVPFFVAVDHLARSCNGGSASTGHPEAAKDPYFLYAASNAGSLARPARPTRS